MFDADSLKPLKTIKQNDRQKIMLAVDSDGNKYLLKEIEGDKREVYKTLKMINHDSIPKIYHIGFADKTTVVEEFIEGISLSELMEKDNVINKKTILSVSKQILDAIDILHKNKIIHRDIKPDNIIVDKSFKAWLIDYDISRIYREEIRKDTEAMGTFGYAPIEQFGMMPTDYKTDIYAFGVTLKTLLDYSGIKGHPHKIADKCKRLDPSLRYQSVGELKRAISFRRFNALIAFLIALILVVMLLVVSISLTNQITDDVDSAVETEDTFDENFEGYFSGFDDTGQELTWMHYNLFSTVFTFRFDQSYEHVLFLEDLAKSGRLKLGKNDTIVDGKMELNDGNLYIELDDRKGHTFSKVFSFNGQYEYEENFVNDLRKNANVSCYDFDADGGAELLIGLNEGSFKDIDKTVYNNFNYCIAWCIKYDENTGFTLCEGDMFSKGASFWINSAVRKLNVYWENFGDINGYVLDGDKIKALR